jgi:hypothetical protein
LVGLGRVSEDQSVKIRVVTKRAQVVVMLSANPQIRLKIQGTLERFEGKVD